METFATLLGLAGLAATAIGMVGLFRPLPTFQITTRGRAALVVVAGFVAFGVGGSMLEDSDTGAEAVGAPSGTTTTTTPTTTAAPPETTITETSTTTAAPTTTTTAPLTGEAAIRAQVDSVLGDQLVDLEAIEQFDGGYGVRVVMNVSDNLTMNLRAGGFKIDAGEIMIRLFNDHPELQVKWVQVEGLFPLIDRYGNTSPGRVVEIRFAGEETEKVNWEYDEASLLLDVLPGLYEWLFIHPEFAEHLP